MHFWAPASPLAPHSARAGPGSTGGCAGLMAQGMGRPGRGVIPVSRSQGGWVPPGSARRARGRLRGFVLLQLQQKRRGGGALFEGTL